MTNVFISILTEYAELWCLCIIFLAIVLLLVYEKFLKKEAPPYHYPKMAHRHSDTLIKNYKMKQKRILTQLQSEELEVLYNETIWKEYLPKDDERYRLENMDAEKILLIDFNDLLKNPIKDVCVAISKTNILIWNIVFVGPVGSPFDQELLQFSVRFIVLCHFHMIANTFFFILLDDFFQVLSL